MHGHLRNTYWNRVILLFSRVLVNYWGVDAGTGRARLCRKRVGSSSLNATLFEKNAFVSFPTTGHAIGMYEACINTLSLRPSVEVTVRENLRGVASFTRNRSVGAVVTS